MNPLFEEAILKGTGASGYYLIEQIQELWSGYGSIIRYGLKGSQLSSVVAKHVSLPGASRHPRGWNTDISHERKVKSYHVETNFYRDWGKLCFDDCYIPTCLALEEHNGEVFMVLEDLDDTGFSERKTSVSMNDMQQCLAWLANFHACFMGKEPKGLWETGTYWHLATRPDELKILDDANLKNAAKAIDLVLRENRYQTFVHGDAKLANFCFYPRGNKVAAVDFQYVGGGCGMKDVAYFIGSCLYEEDCERYESLLLDYYFDELRKALLHFSLTHISADIEESWRPLYAVAWTDFHRFMKGWSPGHWKIHSYSERLAREVVAKINSY